jgi:hypothetical protein
MWFVEQVDEQVYTIVTLWSPTWMEQRRMEFIRKDGFTDANVANPITTVEEETDDVVDNDEGDPVRGESTRSREMEDYSLRSLLHFLASLYGYAE